MQQDSNLKHTNNSTSDQQKNKTKSTMPRDVKTNKTADDPALHYGKYDVKNIVIHVA